MDFGRPGLYGRAHERCCARARRLLETSPGVRAGGGIRGDVALPALQAREIDRDSSRSARLRCLGFRARRVWRSEIWAAADGRKPWPTLSDTVGTIERDHDWTAILVVALLVFGAMHAIRVKFMARPAPVASPGTKAAATRPPAPHNPGRDLLATDDVRLTRAETLEYMGWWGYFLVALVMVIVGYVAPRAVDPTNKQLIGESLYGAIALVLFVIPGWLSYRLGRFVPFPTLFQSFQDIEGRAKWLAVIVAAGLTVLMIHLVFYPWTSILPDLQHLHSYCQSHSHKHTPLCNA